MTIDDLFGTEVPIIQAPMAGSQGSALAIAVSNAGGLGSLPCAMLGPEQIRSELQTIVCAVGAVGTPLGHPALDTVVGGAAAFLP